MSEPKWIKASGNCGFNVDRPIEAAYVNGVALFSFESRLSKSGNPFYSCVVTGHMTCGGATLEEAQREGVRRAVEDGVRGSDRRISRAEFERLVSGVYLPDKANDNVNDLLASEAAADRPAARTKPGR